MSNGSPRIKSLAELGAIWTKTAGETAPPRVRSRSARRVRAEFELFRERPAYGDLPICACAKVCYETKSQAARLYPRQKVYRCPLGHRVYHTASRGLSSRERGLAT